MAPGACLMGISRNTRSLPDFPELAQQLGMVSPKLHAASPARNTGLPRPGLAIPARCASLEPGDTVL